MPLSELLDSDAQAPLEERANILIVDDLPEKLLVFETILADLGQNLVIVRSGSEALREVLRREFAVILMDVNMPGIDGLETARLIRGYRRSALTPIIFVTAYADELQTSQGYSLGAVDYILSPVIPDVLRSKVRVFVDLYITQQRLRQQALERIAIARAEAAQRAAEESTRRSVFLAQAGRDLADSLEADVGMRRLLSLVVPRFAPRALLWLRDTGRGHERVLRCDTGSDPSQPVLFTEGREDMLSEVLYGSTRDAMDSLCGAEERSGAGAEPGVGGMGMGSLGAGRVGDLSNGGHMGGYMDGHMGGHMGGDIGGDIGADRYGSNHGLSDGYGANASSLTDSGDGVGGQGGLVPSRLTLTRRDTGHGVVLPLIAGERVLGGLLLCEPHRPPDWPTLEELAGRAAIAFENARLYGALQAEIVERRQAEASLLEASRRKDEFLAMLSHELRNPLAPIRNAVEVMRQLGVGANERLAQAVAVTDRQVRHLTRLVDELLDVARISQGKIVLKSETVDLRELVAQGLEPVQPLIAAQQQTLRVDLPPGPVWMRGDGARLIQVVTNLLHNAAKYTGPQGLIELTLRTNEAGIELVVRDNGRGIEAELLPHVFDLFEQGPRGLDRTQGGLGVGLTLVQRLVQLHHGHVEATSDGPGRGSAFHVRLPSPQWLDEGDPARIPAGEGQTRPVSPSEAQRDDAARVGAADANVGAGAGAGAGAAASAGASAGAGAGAGADAEALATPVAGTDGPSPARDGVQSWVGGAVAAPARTRRVLVVDDNRDAAESMAVFLELAGFDTRVELDGPGAIAHCTADSPQVVLLDIGLPGLDGYEVAQRIRALPAMKDALLIALTGYGQQEDRRRAHEAGFDIHLVKPADPDAVVDLIANWRRPEPSPERSGGDRTALSS